MLETIALILLILVGFVVVVWVATLIVGLVVANKARKQIQSQFSDENPFASFRSPRQTDWRDHNGF